ncbi:hypothetical protein [Helicobacter zhangjianzhongii]|uniref:Uncharacterized protein n=1 Tax=Helicobacter zhangjianzhongii TaxID=2974574 RepID=A0ACC6FSP2_9HELI|nr:MULTISPECIES: hypothetical protein [unclassified Helicobacter]MDL0079394.1 hypothetical protein [Helicobacter sp. CPD2-1]MDL0081706.1 hypothetical protein [Helicobacter sp. XJK30-2]
MRDKPLIAAPRELDRRPSLISLTRLAKQRFLIANIKSLHLRLQSHDSSLKILPPAPCLDLSRFWFFNPRIHFFIVIASETKQSIKKWILARRLWIATPTSRLAMTIKKRILGFAKIVGDFDPKTQDKRYASKNTPKHDYLKHHNSSSS